MTVKQKHNEKPMTRWEISIQKLGLTRSFLRRKKKDNFSITRFVRFVFGRQMVKK